MSNEALVSEIFILLSNVRFSINDEKALQAHIERILRDEFDATLEREKRLDAKNVIDFLIPPIGIEIKIKGNKKEIYKQCIRYCEFAEIESFILVTAMSIGFPKEINGKDCYVLKLSNAWL